MKRNQFFGRIELVKAKRTPGRNNTYITRAVLVHYGPIDDSASAMYVLLMCNINNDKKVPASL